MTIATPARRSTTSAASVRMANDTRVRRLARRQRGGSGARSPARWLGQLARAVVQSVSWTSDGAQLLNNDNADAHASTRASRSKVRSGTRRSSGDITVTQGVIYAPEPTGERLVGAGDPELFNVLDTTSELAQRLFPAHVAAVGEPRRERGGERSTTTRGCAIAKRTSRSTPTIRSPFTRREPDAEHHRRRARPIAASTASSASDFRFKRGSATFIGRPDLNPTLQITGEYQVNVATRGAVNISVLIGGTLKRPNVSLESDAQPPRTQSELLSLLAFGQSTSSLIASSNSSVASTGTTTDLFGAGAQFAARRLASVALGVAVDQVELQAGRALGTDVFDITPGDVAARDRVRRALWLLHADEVRGRQVHQLRRRS